MPRKLSRRRFIVILERQDPPTFGSGYLPSILATREEASSVSRPADVWSDLLQRNVATLSQPERDVLGIILYCPRLFELQEQRMLPYLPANHPLTGHPFAKGLALRSFRGTLAVASELGHLRFHPVISEKDEVSEEGNEQASVEPGCWIGDFLLFLQDAQGSYCVNLSIKDTESAFSEKKIGVTPRTDLARARLREIARQEVEEALYNDVGIPTVRIAADQLDPMVVANLQQLLLWQKRECNLSADERELILSALQTGLETGASALEVMNALQLSEGFDFYQMKIVLYEAIRKRQLRVDLFERFFIDQPMRPETEDVLQRYGSWFQRARS